ncbi:hypothetical protein I316_07812 [Kwoniella heveanensis BCC8398]|uniref:Uncharacterized protein n=1 Tax=Kwoniella heveanensis BCC8398 TaxID=1296120 RepID=A0A1B9GHJ5_9TREE|nr:hypothetical protein I316_07812 [Kwoniella heveanensis BCC8398]
MEGDSLHLLGLNPVPLSFENFISLPTYASAWNTASGTSNDHPAGDTVECDTQFGAPSSFTDISPMLDPDPLQTYDDESPLLDNSGRASQLEGDNVEWRSLYTLHSGPSRNGNYLPLPESATSRQHGCAQCHHSSSAGAEPYTTLATVERMPEVVISSTPNESPCPFTHLQQIHSRPLPSKPHTIQEHSLCAPPEQRPVSVPPCAPEQEQLRSLMFEFEVTSNIRKIPGSFLSKRPEWQVSVYKGLSQEGSQLPLDLTPSVVEQGLERLISLLIDEPDVATPLFTFTCTASSMLAYAEPMMGHTALPFETVTMPGFAMPATSDNGRMARGRYRILGLHFGQYSIEHDGKLLDPEKVHWRLMHETMCWVVCEISEGKGHPARIRELLAAKIELFLELKDTRSVCLVQSTKRWDSGSPSLLQDYVQLFVGSFAIPLLSLEYACLNRYRRGEWKALADRREMFRRGLEVVAAVVRACVELLKLLVQLSALDARSYNDNWSNKALPDIVPGDWCLPATEVHRQLRIIDLILGELGRVTLAFSEYGIGRKDRLRIGMEISQRMGQAGGALGRWKPTSEEIWDEARSPAARTANKDFPIFQATRMGSRQQASPFEGFFRVPAGRLSSSPLVASWAEGLVWQYNMSHEINAVEREHFDDEDAKEGRTPPDWLAAMIDPWTQLGIQYPSPRAVDPLAHPRDPISQASCQHIGRSGNEL